MVSQKKSQLSNAIGNNIKPRTLSQLSMYSKILRAYRPDQAVISDGKIASIPDEIGGGVQLEQTNASLRPALNGLVWDCGTLANVLGLRHSANVQFYHRFIVAKYKTGSNATFEGFEALVSGTNAGNGALRIASAGAGISTFTTSGAINASGLVRKNNRTESVSALPMDLCVLHTCLNFASPTISTADISTFGYNFSASGRGWNGQIGYIIDCNALTEDDIRELVEFLIFYHNIKAY